jgi:hypothetical protein
LTDHDACAIGTTFAAWAPSLDRSQVLERRCLWVTYRNGINAVSCQVLNFNPLP